MNRKTVLSTALAIAVLLLQCGCGAGTHTARHRSPVRLSDATAICPLHAVYRNLPPACRWQHAWNGMTPIFTTPRRQWGVAYAFNCGSRPRDFSFAEWLPGMDHVALPGTYRHARHGSGYTMIARSRMSAVLKGIPPQFKVDGTLMAVAVASPCTWHVKAILGSRQDVASAVPPIPAEKPPWWT